MCVTFRGGRQAGLPGASASLEARRSETDRWQNPLRQDRRCADRAKADDIDVPLHLRNRSGDHELGTVAAPQIE